MKPRGPRTLVPGRLAGLLPLPGFARTRREKTPLEKLVNKAKQDGSSTLLAYQLGLSPIVKRAGKVETEFEFHASRGWRLDVAIEAILLGIEIDGGGYAQGHHSQGQGIEDDCIKRAEATILGWRVLVVTPRQVKRGQALRWIELIVQNLAAVRNRSGGSNA